LELFERDIHPGPGCEVKLLDVSRDILSALHYYKNYTTVAISFQATEKAFY